MASNESIDLPKVSFFGARKIARDALIELESTKAHLLTAREELGKTKNELLSAKKMLLDLRSLSAFEVEKRERDALAKIAQIKADYEAGKTGLESESVLLRAQLDSLNDDIRRAKLEIVVTEELAILQEVGIYEYRHPLSDVACYAEALAELKDKIKWFNKNKSFAISAAASWTVNGSLSQGQKMVGDVSKLMLSAFNAEADNLVRGLKPYKLERSVERLRKVSMTISRLGKTMNIWIKSDYLDLRIKELELTADFLEKQAREKEAAREERARLQEERKAQAELERERQRLEKERQHYQNALAALQVKGDDEAVLRISHQLEDVNRALSVVDYRSANIRAGYVYVISNVGAFGESMVKIGMTRRLDPMDRINELGDASVPFRFDVHALFFSRDAVTIENEMHRRLAEKRVNKINYRREFFHCTANDAKLLLCELTGELLEFVDEPEALEWRQSCRSHN